MRNRFQTKKQLYVSQRAIALHLIRPSGTFPSKGKAKAKSCRAAREQTSFAPNTETFSAVHNISVVWLSRLARSLGGLGGRSRIEFIVSPLSRRRHNESHFAAQSPECAFLAKPFFAQAKNGVNLRRRSHKNSVDKAKTNRSHHQITVTPAPRSDSLPFPYTAAWLSELCVVSDPPAG